MTDNRPHVSGAAERRINNNHNRDDYRRSRSLGPLENRDKSHLRHRSGSRGFHDPSPDRSASRPRHLNSGGADRTRSRSRRNDSFNSGQTPARSEDRRGRSQVRPGEVRSRNLMSPPSPAEAEETIAKLLPRYFMILHDSSCSQHHCNVTSQSPILCNQLNLIKLFKCCIYPVSGILTDYPPRGREA